MSNRNSLLNVDPHVARDDVARPEVRPQYSVLGTVCQPSPGRGTGNGNDGVVLLLVMVVIVLASLKARGWTF